jgi:hypothetical protein
VLWQSLAKRTKSRVDLLRNAAEREQRITDLDQELLHSSTLCPLAGQVVVLMILSWEVLL